MDPDQFASAHAFLHSANPEGVVRDLLPEALFAAAGFFVVDPDHGFGEEPALDDLGDDLGDGEIDGGHGVARTVLDPAEPGRSLLEGILAGIQGRFEVYLEEITVRERPDPDPRLLGPHWAGEVRQRFDAELRAVAQAARL